MVHRICADTRSKTAGRYTSFKALRQSSPCKPGESEGQTLYLRTPASNPLAGQPARPAGFSLGFTNITSAIQIKLIGLEPRQILTGNAKPPGKMHGRLQYLRPKRPGRSIWPQMIRSLYLCAPARRAPPMPATIATTKMMVSGWPKAKALNAGPGQ